ncbi:MAG: hypothetical protein EBT30_07120, partial [Verrucomicrobia bacterium]|nr:hypothetical protein [Verrucomicrobiota bacterium]
MTVFSNQLKFFNAVPFLKGAYDVDSAIGWSSEGGAITQVDTTTTSNLPIFALFSSSTNPFDSGADFLLVKSRGTAADSYIPKDDSPSSIEISGTATGSDVIFGQYFDATGAFRLATAGSYGQIFNENKSSAVGSPFTEMILNNFGASS